MRRADRHSDSYRLIPSRFPPIGLFEHLLAPEELEAAYALESLTNDRLQDEAGNIHLVAPEDRVVGPGTTPIMAAFTHTGIPSRFTSGQFGVYYAGLDLDTAIQESKFSRERFMRHTQESEQVLTLRCYRCQVKGSLLDVRDNDTIHDPDSFEAGQRFGQMAKDQNELGILYRSVRRPGGECVAILRPPALIPPAIQSGHYQFHWNGQRISHVLAVTEYH